ncbi:hypothetical protein PLICRDRAFT_177055 [Plicaturopsis crispa FD-325 SS-3]|nr:hypothetical protein PLICRDRAFT_177055 [Plicaturopsis crispa FD-325 SS-3]
MPLCAATNNTTAVSTFGNYYNYWKVDANGFDLTRGHHHNSKVIKSGTKGPIRLAPKKTAFAIIDMQNFFLHPNYTDFPAGLATIEPIVKTIKAFRKAGAPVVWAQWGLSDYDILNIPPSYKYSFGTNHDPTKSVGSEMGKLNTSTGVVDMGRKLVRDQWNTEPYGILGEMYKEGLKSGTDFYFPKNRQSALWGAQTPLGIWLEDTEISTLFISGVNIDQCVLGTMNDAYYKGYDFVILEDGTATSSPQYAFDTVIYEANLHGFVVNSTEVVKGMA